MKIKHIFQSIIRLKSDLLTNVNLSQWKDGKTFFRVLEQLEMWRMDAIVQTRCFGCCILIPWSNEGLLYGSCSVWQTEGCSFDRLLRYVTVKCTHAQLNMRNIVSTKVTSCPSPRLFGLLAGSPCQRSRQVIEGKRTVFVRLCWSRTHRKHSHSREASSAPPAQHESFTLSRSPLESCRKSHTLICVAPEAWFIKAHICVYSLTPWPAWCHTAAPLAILFKRIKNNQVYLCHERLNQLLKMWLKAAWPSEPQLHSNDRLQPKTDGSQILIRHTFSCETVWESPLSEGNNCPSTQAKPQKSSDIKHRYIYLRWV